MTGEATPSLADIVSHAIDTGDTSGTLDGGATPAGEGDSTVVDDDAALAAGDGGDADGGAGDDDGAGGEDGGEAGGDADGTGEDDGEGGRARGPDGKFVKGEKTVEETPEQKAAREAKEKQETPEQKAAREKLEADKARGKQPDHINDPIPKDLKKETQDRIRSLITSTKEATEARDKAVSNFETIVNGIKATGTTPQQYGEVMNFMALFNSQDPVKQGQALEALENMADRLALLLGRERTVSDPLKNHPDLREAVTKKEITEKLAREMARTRDGQKFRTDLTTASNAQAEQAAAAERELTTARADLNALEAQLKASDPHYAAKKAQLVEVLRPVFAQTPPSKWKDMFSKAYARMPNPAAPAVRRGPQPMRAGGGGGNKGGAAGAAKSGMASGEGNALDVMNAALAEMGG